MKSISWLDQRARPWGVAALLGAAALVLGIVGCTKDAESSALDRSVAPVPPLAQEEPSQAQAPEAQAAGAATADPGAEPMANKTEAEDDTYALRVEAPDKLASGAEGTVRFVVTPKAGWKMNKDFPTKLQVIAPAEVSVTKAEQVVADAERFDDGGATFAVAFTPRSAGEKQFRAKLKFAVCTDATCTPKNQELAWVVNVE